MDEFGVIKQFCSFQTVDRKDVIIGTGDDCAVLEVPANHQLAVTVDTLIVDVHFPSSTSPFDIGYKALAVNLSDLAAMGATPAWVTFALTIAKVDSDFINELARGFFELASRYNTQLIGGDLTRGTLSLTLQAQGIIPKGLAITRSGAKPNDKIYVSNTLGDAALALAFLKNKQDIANEFQPFLLTRLNRPEPRVTLGEKLRGIASSAIDLSDGLTADLQHILNKSQVGATVFVDQLPLSTALRGSVSAEEALLYALSGGDDYELCFTVPAEKENLLEETLKNIDCGYTCIGVITESNQLDLHYTDGKKFHGNSQGYRHF